MSGEEEETLRHVNREKRRRNCDRGDEMESSDCSVGTWLRGLKFNVIVLFHDIISRHHNTSHHFTSHSKEKRVEMEMGSRPQAGGRPNRQPVGKKGVE